MSNAFLESVNASDSVSSNLLLEEFVVGVTSDEIGNNDSMQNRLASISDQLRRSYEMIDKYPFILLSSQNCTEMIVAVGKMNGPVMLS